MDVEEKLVIVTNEWKLDELSDDQSAWLEANTLVRKLFEEGVKPAVLTPPRGIEGALHGCFTTLRIRWN